MRCIVSAAPPTQWQRAVDELSHVAGHCDAPRCSGALAAAPPAHLRHVAFLLGERRTTPCDVQRAVNARGRAHPGAGRAAQHRNHEPPAPTGYSALIDETGHVHQRSTLGQPALLRATVALSNRTTPYARTGDLPALALAALTTTVIRRPTRWSPNKS